MSVLDATAIRDLIPRIADGDTAAFERFYALTVVQVLRITHSVLRDRAQAEEVAQEVFLELWQNARRLDPDRAGLISTMARRRAIDRVRATQSSRERDHAFATLDYQPERDATAEQGDVRFVFAPVAAAVRALPRAQREVLVLAYVHGCSHSEIARALELPLGTVKTRLRDAILRLRSRLAAAAPY